MVATFEYYDFYEDTYCELDDLYYNDGDRIRFILSEIPNKGARIFDIGCRDGLLASQYKKEGNIVDGVDMSSQAINKACQRGINAVYGDFMQVTYPRIYDIVVAGEVIEHQFDTDFFLDKIKGMLKPNGKLILTTPNVCSLGRRLMMLLGMNPLIEYRAKKDDAGHIRGYTFKNIKDQLKENGFHVEKICSDTVNFDSKGIFKCSYLARICPTLGRSIMLVART